MARDSEPRPVRVTRPGKVSEMTDEERRAYAEQVVEAMRRDRPTE